MPVLPGFSGNAFRTREDCVEATFALLRALGPHKSPKGARIKIPVSTGVHFDETAAQLEGFARPLWGVGALLASESGYDADGQVLDELKSWVHGLFAGTDCTLPGGPNGEFWGPIKDMDQRMVEMEIVSFALLSAPAAFFPQQHGKFNSTNDVDSQQNWEIVTSYLSSINDKEMPPTNWLWFRVLTNLALVNLGAVSYTSLKTAMNNDLDTLESYHIGGGWSSDGTWSDNGRQADYYSGSFAIQFSQLLYAKYAADLDPDRCVRFRERAKLFASDFLLYFDSHGAAIPFGRSLTYRFAMGGFWAMVALAEIPLPADLTLGHVKGLLLRHLRWWAEKPEIFHSDGTLNIGFAYPNTYLSEDYNSPQSPYWCMKSLVAIALPADHEFWTCTERPHPISFSVPGALKEKGTAQDGNVYVKALVKPRQILVHAPAHHFLLSSGQFCPWPIKASEAKYCKFAYSSSFGFSVPTGTLLQQMAPDSTLAISEDAGDTWKVRWKSDEPEFGYATFKGAGTDVMQIPTLINTWTPSRASKIKVKTTLISPTARWPHWHVRVHEISSRSEEFGDVDIQMSEGGFAVNSFQEDSGLALPQKRIGEIQANYRGRLEGTAADKDSSVVFSSSGISGIVQLSTQQAQGVVLKPDSNTNLMTPRSLIPTIQQTVTLKSQQAPAIFITAVFAISAPELLSNTAQVLAEWKDRPVLKTGQDVQDEVITIHL
ncbi:hypothetical protein BP6252_11643 [Coleophoma cylindrospora]|uniref:DUF2264 domain-containing protein n=1 Tax=Coleophoma cylindrospora TaxID=1849047 RepID=A0A3D8QKM1_9HELO|nr:hypothetical protein BP6252_11643 [Coleophoma cylindrospora]